MLLFLLLCDALVCCRHCCYCRRVVAAARLPLPLLLPLLPPGALCCCCCYFFVPAQRTTYTLILRVSRRSIDAAQRRTEVAQRGDAAAIPSAAIVARQPCAPQRFCSPRCTPACIVSIRAEYARGGQALRAWLCHTSWLPSRRVPPGAAGRVPQQPPATPATRTG